MNNSLISVKGNKEGLQLICSDKGSWNDLLTEIKTLLTGESRQFFRGASVLVDTGTRILTAEQVGALWQALQDGGLTVRCLKTETADEFAQSLKGLGKGQEGEKGKQPEKDKKGFMEKDFVLEKNQTMELSETEDLNSRPVLIIKRNLRSGQKISFDGNVLIFGDVNPGAEVLASGFIMVFGYLRGIAHAGTTGDEKVWVLALRLQPTQLRIADSITRPPDEEPQGPEIAKIQNGSIICEGIDFKKYYEVIGGN